MYIEPMHVVQLTIVILLGISLSCTSGGHPIIQTNPDPRPWNPINKEFREFYGWDDSEGTWSLYAAAYKKSETVAYHVFTPDGNISVSPSNVKGTVFILHGYLEHSALRVPIAAEAVGSGWLAVGIDLPGHGFSSGL
ncbi:hypothetical protein MASR2M78_10950 [Treponema sp.]